MSAVPSSILIFDQRPASLRLLVKCVTRAGFDVVTAHDWAGVYQSMEETIPQLMLSSQPLSEEPHFYETLKCPVLFLNAEGNNSTQSDKYFYTPWPFEPFQLIKSIKNILDHEDISTPEEIKNAVDVQVLDNLSTLGGDEFTIEIITQFLSDAQVIIGQLTEAVEKKDLEDFHDKAHALRSCAANVGASQIYKLCLSWRESTQEELDANGRQYLEKIHETYQHAHTDLRAWVHAHRQAEGE